MDLDVWACPVCFSPLAESGKKMVCLSEGRSFRQLDGLVLLVRPDQESLLVEARSLSYTWQKTKWAPRHDDLVKLPYIRRPGWKQKAQSLRELLEILGSPRGRLVADIGAGTGWLSYRLAQAGFRCFATDISSDSDVGLGAATCFDSTPNRFERALATMDSWPLRAASLDVAICSASLHYLADVRVGIAEAARVLRPGGAFVIMNTPVHRDRESADRASRDFAEAMRGLGGRGRLVRDHQHFVSAELENDLADRFSSISRHEPRNGFWFSTSRALKGALFRMELASFPIYEARAPH